MKRVSLLLFAAVMGVLQLHAQNTFPTTGSAGIGTVAPNAKAALEVMSTTQGVLLPRMTTAQRNAIVTPPLGLLIYQIDGTKGLYQYNGSAWAAVSSTSFANKTLANLTAPTAVSQSLLPGITNTIDLGSATKAWRNGFFNGNLTIANGTQGAGKVLTSDSAGLATWQAVPVVAETDPQVAVTDTSSVPRWNGAALVTGTITDNGTNVGIGTTNPAATLDVNGTIKISGGSPGAGKILVSDATGIGSWNTLSALETDPQVSVADTSAVPRWNGAALVTGTITDKGTKVGIGTTNPTALLDVNGDAQINGLRIGRGNNGASTNMVIGSDFALASNTTGTDNIAIGRKALQANTKGSSNVAIGNFTLSKNTTIPNLVAIGDSALMNNRTTAAQPEFGIFNTAVGAKTLCYNTDGGLNVAVGSYALYKNTTGGYNTATGAGALYLNTTGINNTANGAEALTLNNIGGNNTASGYHAQRENRTGSNNTATGAEALKYNTTGDSNTANGSGALFSNKGSNNTANGSGALYSNTTGYSNVAVGVVALYKNVNGHNIVAIGDSSLYNQTSVGNYNTGVGSKSLYKSTNSGGNTAIGFYTLYNITTGNYNTALGYGANSAITTESNSTGIGYDAEPGATNSIAVGNPSITSIKGQVGFTTFSDQRFKKNIKEGEVKGLEFINLLRPVTYNTDISAYAKWKEANYGEKDTTNWEGKYDVEKIRFSGFLAQEVEATANKIGYDFSGVDKPKNSKDIYGLRYSEFVVPLVKAVQELSKKNDELGMVNGQLKMDNEQLKANDANLQKQIDELKAMILGSAKPIATINQQDVSFETASLDQNIPNPPAGNFTKINYNIPNGATKAELVIVDNAGRKLKQISLSTFGKGVLNVDTKGLASGTYTYTMYVDGKMIDSKKMVVGK